MIDWKAKWIELSFTLKCYAVIPRIIKSLHSIYRNYAHIFN